MDKETLARAKELEIDIQHMESALSYYKQGQWSPWDTDDHPSTFHFEFCKNWSRRSVDMQELPTWLNKPLMETVERELERCKREMETLGNEVQKTCTVDDEKTDTVDDVKEAAKILALPTVEHKDPHKETWEDDVAKTLKRMMNWTLYSLVFCFLFGVAGLELSVRENVAYSLMLGLVVGSINNIERVMRELFKQEDSLTIKFQKAR